MQSEAILQLGKKIVDELGLDQSVDTLGRWMAHYIAELIHDAETANDNDRVEKSSRCAKTILEFWKHRYMLPDGKRPFEEFEPILRALESLDPHDNTPKYYRSTIMAAANEEQRGETKKWLDLVKKLDSSAKILIRYCLTRAADNALDTSKEWVRLVANLEAEGEGTVEYFLRIIINENELLSDSSPQESTRRELEDRMQKLDYFLETAKIISSDLRERLQRLDGTDAAS